MIHQFILAAPRPGLSASEFQDYWLHVHAVNYASKIPQITRYLIDSRLPVEAAAAGNPGLPHQGIAEIWLNNEEEQLASLQTPEFLQGARRDEPNWAAFWLTLVLDTTAYEVVPGPAQTGKDPDWVKLTVLSKRAPGLPLAEFRERSLDQFAPVLAKTPGVQRYLHAQTRDGLRVRRGRAGRGRPAVVRGRAGDAGRPGLAVLHRAGAPGPRRAHRSRARLGARRPRELGHRPGGEGLR